MPCDEKTKPEQKQNESAFCKIRNIIKAEIKAGRWVGTVVAIKSDCGGAIIMCDTRNNLKSDLRGLPVHVAKTVKEYDCHVGNTHTKTPDSKA